MSDLRTGRIRLDVPGVVGSSGMVVGVSDRLYLNTTTRELRAVAPPELIDSSGVVENGLDRPCLSTTTRDRRAVVSAAALPICTLAGGAATGVDAGEMTVVRYAD